MYEYLTIKFDSYYPANSIAKKLNQLAEMGWRFITLDQGLAVFEREKVEKKKRGRPKKSSQTGKLDNE